MKNTIDQNGRMIPYVKTRDGIYNESTGKYDLPKDGYRFPIYLVNDGMGNKIYKPHPTTNQMKKGMLPPNHLKNRKGKTIVQYIKLLGNKIKTIFHFPKLKD